MGTSSSVSSTGGLAIGFESDVTGLNATAIGNNAVSSGAQATAIGIRANAGGQGAAAVGRDADASGTFALAVGLDATASATGSAAIGLQAEASGVNATAIGRGAGAAGRDATAIGKDAESDQARSTAIGFGAATTLADQMMFGTAATTYVLPGITSATSLARQGAVTGLLTTDANGNLASDGGALEARVTALEGQPEPVTGSASPNALAETATPEASSGTVKTAAAAETVTSTPTTTKSVASETISTNEPIAEASHVKVSENGELSIVDRNNRGEAILSETDVASNDATLSADIQSVSSDVIGANLITEPGTVKTPVPRVAQNLNIQDAASNLLLIEANTANISANRADITRNSSRIDEAFVQIGQNVEGILNNNIRLDDLEQGLAAVAALPDMYLAQGESMSASGGLGIYGDSVGFGGTIAVRGNDSWTFGASVGLGGDEATGKLQVRWAK